MAWIQLIIAGLFEVVWATTMKLSTGFTKPLYSFLTLAGMALSFFFLIRATRTLPLRLAYPIWTGVDAVGSVIVGSLLFKDQLSLSTWFFVLILLVGIIGIKVTSGH